MEILSGKKRVQLDEPGFAERLARHDGLWIDLGCGDAKFTFRTAIQHPDILVLGLDAAREPMVPQAVRARRSPKKGGAPNLILAAAAVEDLPDMLRHRAETVSINFPWGSLLRAIVMAEQPILASICQLLRPAGSLDILLNDSLYAQPHVYEKMNLVRIDQEHLETITAPALTQSDLDVQAIETIPNHDIPVHTSWGRRLADSHPDGKTWHISALRQP
ncbi:MAG: hypothetical protein J7M25_06125 [Deltaproteobacteria bacterium]|nr:hypothetical protein [Deltaproteobacteria bacterium]